MIESGVSRPQKAQNAQEQRTSASLFLPVLRFLQALSGLREAGPAFARALACRSCAVATLTSSHPFPGENRNRQTERKRFNDKV
jgi:hypothetical protein